MATHCTVKFSLKDDNEELTPIVNVYHHYDGYIDGVGYDLAKWLCKKTMVNGLPLKYDKNMCNGIGCLVAQYIHNFKEEPGGVYIYPLNNLEDEYHYDVIIKDSFRNSIPVNDITEITVTSYDEIIFKGSPKELLEFKEEGG